MLKREMFMELLLAMATRVEVASAANLLPGKSPIALQAIQRMANYSRRERALKANQRAAPRQFSAEHLPQAKMVQHQSLPRALLAVGAWQSGPPRPAFSAPSRPWSIPSRD